MLNQEQSNAYDEVLTFLFGEDPFIIIDGSAGTGKSYLIKYMTEHLLDDYRTMCSVNNVDETYTSIVVTATTNKACANLNVLKTLYSILNMRLMDNYSNGRTDLVSLANAKFTNNIVIVDECSMVTSELFKQICKNTHNKYIFIGDRYQLPPVNESISPIYSTDAKIVELNTIMRTKDLTKLYFKAKDMVKNEDTLIQIGLNKDIYHIEDFDSLINILASKDDYLICSYTNKSVLNYAYKILTAKGLPYYNTQTTYVLNEGIHSFGTRDFNTDDEVTLKYTPQNATVDGFSNTMIVKSNGECGVLVPKDPTKLSQILKIIYDECSKNKDWVAYFQVKNHTADLRPAFSRTVHKAQGSTVDKVIIDLDDFKCCRDKDTLRRLLYVAITRAKSKIIFVGNHNLIRFYMEKNDEDTRSSNA